MPTIAGVSVSEEDAKLYTQYIQEAAYADRLQYVFKIKLNSLYGALSNLYFRFYDLRLGESTTATGRAILKHQCRTVALLLDGKYDVEFPMYATPEECVEHEIDPKFALHGTYFNSNFESKSVVYGDTDSCYFKTGQTNVADAIAVADVVADEVNQSFPQFMRSNFLCQPGFDTLIKAAREVVSDRGIFVEKKRYCLHLVDKDGKPVDDMKVMGLDTKKTILPKQISKVLNQFIESFLKGMSWDQFSEELVKYKDELVSSGDIIKYGLPTGVNNVEKYTSAYLKEGVKARLPGGVAAAIHYNLALEEYGDKVSLPITSGTKIKKFYLKQARGKFKTIALPTDQVEIPEWFTEHYEIDNQAMIKRLVDNPINNIVKAIGKKPPTKATILDTKLFEY